MTANVSTRRMAVNAGETINETVDVEGLLKGTELATGTPVVVEINTADLTITNKAVNTANQTVDGRTVLPGEGIDYTITGFVSGIYKISITFSTDSTPAATRSCQAQYAVS